MIFLLKFRGSVLSFAIQSTHIIVIKLVEEHITPNKNQNLEAKATEKNPNFLVEVGIFI
ncbi:MAG: hypothetical protein AV945_gp34 [Phormidium phage MIS-PhV1B]|uniref:hypothetical protein n=1 Tax=Phormidium phage MIS-PhV1B TaxID=1391456 RepID=UPI0003C9AFA2|nr:MAG: hypothetical protein AV945_gp34 [Phormidium phage MIS-PhV1B]AGZ61842.1 MAG: hypothetical protein [Phormidium phage MIS-PhV1B]